MTRSDEPTTSRRAELYASLQPPAWYVVCADREYRARDGLLDIGIETWLPECRVVVSRRRARTVVDGPLFPGYLFVRGVLGDEWAADVLGVRDVDDFVRMQTRPLAAPEGQMTKLRQLVAAQGGRVLIEAGRVKRGYGYTDEATIKPGQAVRVLDGPFSGFNALVKAVGSEERIKIILDIFGRATETEILEASVELVA